MATLREFHADLMREQEVILELVISLYEKETEPCCSCSKPSKKACGPTPLDVLAYSDSVNFRIRLYLDSAFNFFRMYFKQLHTIEIANYRDACQQLFKFNFINAQELKLLLTSVEEVLQLDLPDESEEVFNESLMNFFDIMSTIVLNLEIKKPKNNNKQTKKQLKENIH